MLADKLTRMDVLQWLIFQMGGGEYTIADIAAWPSVSRYKWHPLDNGLNDGPHMKRWYSEIAARPCVQNGSDAPARGQAVPKA